MFFDLSGKIHPILCFHTNFKSGILLPLSKGKDMKRMGCGLFEH